MVMTNWQATTFLIGGYFDVADASPVFTVVDGLTWMRQSVLRNSMVRQLGVKKTRGQELLFGVYMFRITSSGIKVFAAVQSMPQNQSTLLPPLTIKHRKRSCANR